MEHIIVLFILALCFFHFFIFYIMCLWNYKIKKTFPMNINWWLLRALFLFSYCYFRRWYLWFRKSLWPSVTSCTCGKYHRKILSLKKIYRSRGRIAKMYILKWSKMYILMLTFIHRKLYYKGSNILNI